MVSDSQNEAADEQAEADDEYIDDDIFSISDVEFLSHAQLLAQRERLVAGLNALLNQNYVPVLNNSSDGQ